MDRTCAILLGRLYRANGNLREAIDALDRFLNAKNGVQDHNYAGALYNRACYHTLLWKDTSDENYKRRALDDLKLSLERNPINKEDVRQDPDFDSLREDSTFKKLME